MQELLIGSLGSQLLAYAQQHPWRVFAADLVALLLIDMLFRQRSSGTGDFPVDGLDFGGDGDCGGD